MIKKSFSLITLLFLIVSTLIVFQNCQPMTTTEGGNNSSSTLPDPPFSGSVGEQYFIDTIRPLFKAQCVSCHAEPRLVLGTPGSLAIYNYTPMRALLTSGVASALANNLIRKVTSAEPHLGGNTCTQGITAADPICGKLITWYQKEFPTSEAGLAGTVTSVSFNGTVNGWALDPLAPANKVRVYFYIDGPAGTGTLLGNVLADMTDLGPYGSHYFAFQIPDAMINNKTHQLYVYLGSVTAANLAPGTPMSYAAYKRTAEGNSYFASNIQPTITANCNACHAFTIDSGYANMSSPLPLQGGTPTNNNFITNARGSSHPFNGCPGGINSGLCSAIQQWWTIEFGP